MTEHNIVIFNKYYTLRNQSRFLLVINYLLINQYPIKLNSISSTHLKIYKQCICFCHVTKNNYDCWHRHVMKTDCHSQEWHWQTQSQIMKIESDTWRAHIIKSKVAYAVRVTRSLVLWVCFVGRCLSFCVFSFGHYVACSSSIYGFWLPLWYLQTLHKVESDVWRTQITKSKKWKVMKTYSNHRKRHRTNADHQNQWWHMTYTNWQKSEVTYDEHKLPKSDVTLDEHRSAKSKVTHNVHRSAKSDVTGYEHRLHKWKVKHDEHRLPKSKVTHIKYRLQKWEEVNSKIGIWIQKLKKKTESFLEQL